MVSDRIVKTLKIKSKQHQSELERLGQAAAETPLSANIITLDGTPQIRGINTILMDPETSREEFVFYFDRLASLLMEHAASLCGFEPEDIRTPQNNAYKGLKLAGEVSAVVILRGGSTLETGLRRVIPDCRTGRVLIQTSYRTGEPELHYYKFADGMEKHNRVLLLDPQLSSGGAALMAVRVLLDHGVEEKNIVFVTYMAGRLGLNRLMNVFPEIHVVVVRIVDGADGQKELRWVEERYCGTP